MTNGASGSSTSDAVDLPKRDAWIALAVCVVLALAWTIPLSRERAMGWDESMHVAWPAARIAADLRALDLGGVAREVLGCAQYPFVWPLAAGVVEAVVGTNEHVLRVLTTLAWCATLFGIVLVARELVAALRRARGERAGDRWVPFVAVAFAAACPLALAFAGTLFLEVPSACVMTWALRAWLVRARSKNTPRERRAELVAGAWIAIALFTKFNYGLMLGAALALDWAIELVRELRAGRTRAFARRTAWLALVPAIACAWWFVLPLPEGSVVAAQHRAAFMDFLAGNRDFKPTPTALRVLWAGEWFAWTPRALVLEIALALVALRWLRSGALCPVLALLGLTVLPIALHPFHLDRFDVVCGPALCICAAVGAGTALAHVAPSLRMVAALGAVGLCAVFPSLDREALARACGQLPDAEPVRAYVLETLGSWHDLTGDRALPTAGLPRAEHDALVALVLAKAGLGERVGWIGMSNELSPAALELALGAREPGRLRRTPRELDLDVAYFAVDPRWDDARLAAWARGFDVIVTTDPIDLKGRAGDAGRAFLKGYVERLLALGWSRAPIGTVSIARPLKDALDVTVYACRPNR